MLRVPDRPTLAFLDVDVARRAPHGARPSSPDRRVAGLPAGFASPASPPGGVTRALRAPGAIKSGFPRNAIPRTFWGPMGTRKVSVAHETKEKARISGLSYSGGGIRTRDLRVMSGFWGDSYLGICRAFVKFDVAARGQICLFWYLVRYPVLTRRQHGVARVATYQRSRQSRSSSTALSSRRSATFSAGRLVSNLLAKGLRRAAILIRTPPGDSRRSAACFEQLVVP